MLTACSIGTKPLATEDRYRLATETVTKLFSDSPKKAMMLDYYECLARSIKYNLDYRIKVVNTAIEAGQLDVAAYAMFPALNFTGSVYTRSNDLSISGITSQGQTTGLSTSTPRTLRTARGAISWNLLDFGMGYLRAKQQGDKVLIAIEESRRQAQQLAQDVLVAYWVAYSSQELLNDTKKFKILLTNAKQILEKAVKDKTVPQESLLNYQGALLEGDRKLIQLQYKYDKAMLDLKHLLFLPVDQKITLAPPPSVFYKPQNLKSLSVWKMDAVTLVNHPQLQGQHYQERLTQLGLKTVLLQALPGITLNYGRNYDSNKFLLNKQWLDRSLDVSWNLLNLASLPSSYKTAKIQIQYENLKSMALTMAALTETRYAFSHYQTLLGEYNISHEQTKNAKAIYILNQNRELASLASHQQVIMAKLKNITSKMDEDLLLSDLSVALGQLYLSVGIDIVPDNIESKPLDEATHLLKNHFEKQYTYNFISYIDNTYADIFKNTSVHFDVKSTYTVQLIASHTLKDIQTTINNIEDKHSLIIGKITYDNNDWYILCYGSYRSKTEAAVASEKFTSKYKQFTPWIRKTDKIQWINQENPSINA